MVAVEVAAVAMAMGYTAAEEMDVVDQVASEVEVRGVVAKAHLAAVMVVARHRTRKTGIRSGYSASQPVTVRGARFQ